MKRWAAWKKYIAEGGKASWPTDEFEILIDLYEEEIKKLKGEKNEREKYN